MVNKWLNVEAKHIIRIDDQSHEGKDKYGLLFQSICYYKESNPNKYLKELPIVNFMFYSSVEKAILKSEKSMLKFCLTIIIYP
jgi:hypothetical protein